MSARTKSPPGYRMGSLILALLILSSLALTSASTLRGIQYSYIVRGLSSNQASSLILKVGGRVTDRLEIIQGVVANLNEAQAASLRQLSGITSVWENGPVEASGKDSEYKNGSKAIPATDYPDVVGADYVWQQGVTGEDVTIAIVDSGLDFTIPAYRAEGGINERTLAWVDLIDGKHKPYDPYGHGTHLAGVIANSQIGA